MKRLLAVILVAALAWSGYWLVGANARKSGLSDWFETRRDAGWQADYRDLAVRGFPNRFDATLTDLALADPGTGLAWRAPFFQLFTLSYQPRHVIAIWPNEQVVANPSSTYNLTSGDMRASIVLLPGDELPVERMAFVSESLGLRKGSDPVGTADRLRIAMNRVEDGGPRYKLALAAESVTSGGATSSGAGSVLPGRIALVQADATVTFDRAWDITALERARPQPTGIELHLVQARWGELELLVAGSVTVDAQGRADGEITIKAKNWRDILKLARNSGNLPAGLIDSLEQALQLLSGLSGNRQTLDIPVRLSRGRASIGIVPLGDAPVLRIP